MADRPDHDLADRLLLLASEMGNVGYRGDKQVPHDLRAAAVRLRKLDAAIADVRAEFDQALSDDAETSGFLTWIERLDTVLADALGGTGT